MSLLPQQCNPSLGAELLAQPHVVLLPYVLATAVPPPCAGLGMLALLEQCRLHALRRVSALLGGDACFVAQPWRQGLAVGACDARLLTLLGDSGVRVYDAQTRVFVAV